MEDINKNLKYFQPTARDYPIDRNALCLALGSASILGILDYLMRAPFFSVPRNLLHPNKYELACVRQLP